MLTLKVFVHSGGKKWHMEAQLTSLWHPYSVTCLWPVAQTKLWACFKVFMRNTVTKNNLTFVWNVELNTAELGNTAVFINLIFFLTLAQLLNEIFYYYFATDLNFSCIQANCPYCGTCVQKSDTRVHNNPLHAACWSKLSWFSSNTLSSFEPSHAKWSKSVRHSCVCHKYLWHGMFVMSAAITKCSVQCTYDWNLKL